MRTLIFIAMVLIIKMYNVSLNGLALTVTALTGFLCVVLDVIEITYKIIVRRKK